MSYFARRGTVFVAAVAVVALVVVGGLFPEPFVHLRYHATGPLFGHREPAAPLQSHERPPVAAPGAEH